MLTSLGLVDDHGVTEKGKRLSKIRVIDGTTFRLWNVSKVGRLLGKIKAEPQPASERPVFVEPEVQELLTSNVMLDALPTPEPDVEELAA